MAITRTRYIPIDERDPQSVRALILTRTSDPSGTASDVASQVDQCSDFIRQMGWTLLHPDDPYRFTETKTGVRQVRRPVLDAVLALAQKGEVDVIVTLAPARIARKKSKRYHAVEAALEYGVEFRFATRAADRGRYPGGLDGLLAQLKDDLFDEEEAHKIAERLSPGRMARYQRGMPHGGKAGPNYGYTEGDRRVVTGATGRQGRVMGVLTWEIDEPRAQWVRWMFQQADTTPVGELSLRHLAVQLDALGAPAPLRTGANGWSRTAVSRILTQPKYAGHGRNLTSKVEWVQETDDDRRVYEVAKLRPRGADETFPIPASAIPPLVDEAQFARVQLKLAELAQHRRSIPRTDDPDAYVPLLDAGLIRCAVCGGWMARWRNHRSRERYYRCARTSTVPGHYCTPHVIPARQADALALERLAFALTDPEHALAIADAARSEQERAETDEALASASRNAARSRLETLTSEREKLVTALTALGALEGMEAQVAGLRDRLASLEGERDEMRALVAQGASQAAHAHDRAAFLREMFTLRGGIIDFATGVLTRTGAPRVRLPMPGPRDDGRDHRDARLTLTEAAALLGVAESEVDLPTEIAFGDSPDETVALVRTGDVLLRLLRQLPRERLRALLRAAHIVALVKPPRPRSDWPVYGQTPAWRRVGVRLMDTLEVWADDLEGTYPSR